MSRHGDFNTTVEDATARNFIQWYNQKTGRNLTFKKKQETPDFIYFDENGEIGVEVTTAHYNQDHARFTAETGRGKLKTHTIQKIINNPEGIEGHTVCEPEKSLIDFINKLIKKKCAKPYGKNCVLIIRVLMPALTTDREFQHEVIPDINLPEQNPFKEVYLTNNQQAYFKLA
jgi:hypothetical protein